MRRGKIPESLRRYEKRLYDREYRKANAERIKRMKRIYNASPAGRAMQKRNREKMKDRHLEYCRQPEYVKQKAKYDLEWRNKKRYGVFWRVMLLQNKLHKEVIRQVPDKYERMVMRGNIARMLSNRKRRMSLLNGWNE